MIEKTNFETFVYVSKNKYQIFVYDKNNYEVKKILELKTNFDYRRIQTLYSNLSSLNIPTYIEPSLCTNFP